MPYAWPTFTQLQWETFDPPEWELFYFVLGSYVEYTKNYVGS